MSKTAFEVSVAAISAALDRIEANRGKDGFRFNYDKAVHIYTALKGAGLKVIKDARAKPQGRTLCQVFTDEGKGGAR